VTPPGPGPIRPFDLPAVTRSVLSSTAPVLAARHGAVPIATVVVVLDAGTVREPAESAGLAWLTAAALDTGAGHRSGEELAWEFERLGAELDADAGYDAMFVRLTVPVARLEPALALLADVVRRPSFPDDEVRRLRGEQLAEILQRAKEPRAHANDLIVRFVYGESSPYGRPLVGLSARVRTLGRDNVAAFHAARFQPGSSTLIVVGNVGAERALDLLDPLFGDWPDAAVPTPAASLSSVREASAIHLVERTDAVQSEIRIAHIGVERRHRDYFALRVMNTLLGGAFTSRLNLNLRERHGFTYGVRSAFAFRRTPGPFVIQTAVATDVTARAIEEILREVARLRDEGAGEEEVANARDYLVGLMPLELETTEQVAIRLADLAVYDLPADYFQHYRASTAAVTPADVNRVAREHLHNDRFTTVVLGNVAEIGDSLASLNAGPVHVHTAAESHSYEAG
jgi:zinc protease